MGGNVAMVALVEGLESEQGCGGARGCGGLLLLPGHRWCIVGEDVGGSVVGVRFLGNNVAVCDRGGKFQITVGDATRRVGPRHQRLGDMGRERLAPQDRDDGPLRCGDKMDAAHAGAGSIAGAECVGIVPWEELRQACRAYGEVAGQPPPVIQGQVHRSVELQAVGRAIAVTEGFLQGTEQTAASRYG